MPESDDSCHSVLLGIHILTIVSVTVLPEFVNPHPRDLGGFCGGIKVPVFAFLKSEATDISVCDSKLVPGDV